MRVNYTVGVFFKGVGSGLGGCMAVDSRPLHSWRDFFYVRVRRRSSAKCYWAGEAWKLAAGGRVCACREFARVCHCL